MTTLRDLARHLGLSPATVSRALNGFPEVGSRTRQRVVAASKEFNYKPNFSARRLATGKSGMVGMIFGASRNLLVDPHFVDYLAGLSGGLARHGLDLVIHTATAGAQMDAYDRLAASGSVDGLFVSAPETADIRIENLLARKFPFVVHGRDGENPAYAYYDIDNHGALEAAAHLLIDLGHQRIAFLNGPEGLAFADQRESGFRAAIDARNTYVPAAFSANDEMSEELGYAQASTMLAGRYGAAPTAFLCASTLQALGVMRAAAEHGLGIGRDISLIAHDDVLPHLRAENFATPLSVTRAPIRDAGVALAEMMTALIGGAAPQSLQKTVLADLIVRASTGAAPATGKQSWP